MQIKVLFLVLIFALISMIAFEYSKMPVFECIKFNAEKDELLIGIISDTHIPARAKELPDKAKEFLKNVDLIIHAGDIVSLGVIEELEKIAQVIAVYGNKDPFEVREKLRSAVCIEIYEWKIGVVHNSIFLWKEKMERIAKENNFNILIFGHTHRPFLKHNEILLINPGSPTNPFFARPSIAFIKMTKDFFEGEIKYLK